MNTISSVTSTRKQVKAVGLISGGLDSTLAAKIMKELEVEVHGVYYAMPWGCCDKAKAQLVAEQLGISFIVLKLDDRYLEVVKHPQYGYGTALNPCVDCRIHMFSRAAQYMRTIGADFVFTGEVLGQRPMSQMRKSMQWIEQGAGLEGRLLRPLSAQLLEPTLPEKEGFINREKLLKISGRSRKEQLKLAEQFEIGDYSPPAGGCLLTDKNFARRMKDTLDHGYRNFRETMALKWGRHFRFSPQYKAIVGREEEENAALIRYAHEEDTIMELVKKDGPTLILKGDHPPQTILTQAAGLVQRFSRYRDQDPVEVEYWSVKDKTVVRRIRAQRSDEAFIESIRI